MRMLFVGIVAVGFIVLDIVVILALSNMMGWSSISSGTLFWMMIGAVVGMTAGLIWLRWIHQPTPKG